MEYMIGDQQMGTDAIISSTDNNNNIRVKWKQR